MIYDAIITGTIYGIYGCCYAILFRLKQNYTIFTVILSSTIGFVRGYTKKDLMSLLKKN